MKSEQDDLLNFMAHNTSMAVKLGIACEFALVNRELYEEYCEKKLKETYEASGKLYHISDSELTDIARSGVWYLEEYYQQILKFSRDQLEEREKATEKLS